MIHPGEMIQSHAIWNYFNYTKKSCVSSHKLWMKRVSVPIVSADPGRVKFHVWLELLISILLAFYYIKNCHGRSRSRMAWGVLSLNLFLQTLENFKFLWLNSELGNEIWLGEPTLAARALEFSDFGSSREKFPSVLSPQLYPWKFFQLIQQQSVKRRHIAHISIYDFINEIFGGKLAIQIENDSSKI